MVAIAKAIDLFATIVEMISANAINNKGGKDIPTRSSKCHKPVIFSALLAAILGRGDDLTIAAI